MGLDAVVFRNVRRLEDSYGRGLFDVDEETGEAETRADVAAKVPREAYFAAQERFGNLAEIGWLRRIVEGALGPGSFVARRVVYSGSHSGDVIRVDELPLLREDVAALRGQNRPDLSLFLAALDSLLEHAGAENNPIVFV